MRLRREPLTIPKVFIASGFPWLFATSATKISILMMYCDIFVPRPFRMACRLNMGVIGAFCLGLTLVLFLNCRPFRLRWEPHLAGTSDRCGSIPAEQIAGAGINVLLDIVVILLPQPLVWGLQTNWRRKFAVSGIFSLGTL